MDSVYTSVIVLACVGAGALCGIVLRRSLPEHHLSAESRDTIKIGAGLVATMAALLLGLLVASAKGSYDDKKGEITQIAAKIAFLDRSLSFYGPETQEARKMLKIAVATMIEGIWSNKGPQPSRVDGAKENEALFGGLQRLDPKTETQRYLKGLALGTYAEIGQTHWLLIEQGGRSISTPFLAMVIFWLSTIFLSYGLMAPRNATVFVTLLLCALSVSGAFFLVLEMEHPFDGLIQISSTPLRNLAERVGQ